MGPRARDAGGEAPARDRRLGRRDADRALAQRGGAAARARPRDRRRPQQVGPGAPARVRSLRVPTLLLQGGDGRGPFTTAVEMVDAALPDSRVAVMPGQGHVAMDTGTEQFTAEVLGFLERTAA